MLIQFLKSQYTVVFVYLRANRIEYKYFNAVKHFHSEFQM